MESKQEIIHALIDNHKIFTDYVISLSEEDFMRSTNSKWTAGQQMDHIFRSTSALSTALIIPSIFFKLLFGTSRRQSKDYDSLVQLYLLKLANGAKSPRGYIPGTIFFNYRTTLSGKLTKSVSKICRATDKFSEEDLDDLLMPHPVLGKITFREMLYFTIYHVEHHYKLTKRNIDLGSPH